MQHQLFKWGAFVCRQRQILRDPLQSMAQFHGAAPRVVAIQVLIGSGYDGKDRPQMRVARQGGAPLGDAKIRPSQHANRPIRPALPGDPIDRVRSIVIFLNGRLEEALAGVSPAYILDHHSELSIQENSISRYQRRPLAVRGTDKQCRVFAGAGGRYTLVLKRTLSRIGTRTTLGCCAKASQQVALARANQRIRSVYL